ncbi:hypothetical protein BKA66DRAFT_423855 [Pyrenochaeta sp. MPI-SDFR-AT-0127]|nr:hypothetical protein BKA66DRAFT_423855 [Pyrenochaeta sp. MPI-SDFR-AT-0127]
MSNSSSTFKSFSTSYSSSSVNGQTTSHSESTYSDPSGTKVHRTSQQPGQQPVEERYETDHTGRRVTDGRDATQHRIQDVTEQEGQREKEGQAQRGADYEERMEDEYAKREGGA